ncbi:MAG: hypothetical protein OXH31_01775 [Gammaproteobacteria bacterium]|nr:hypothetical protein [Gammaproteobacteria bacterium]
MLNIRTLWTFAVAEMRSCRRLTRTWLILAVIFLFCTGWYMHKLGWNYPRAPGPFLAENNVTARYMLSSLLNDFIAIFSIGFIFLAFDIRARDVQNRIADVIDSLPASNVEIIIGRLAGIFLLLFIPCVVFLAVLAGYESISGLFESRSRLDIPPLWMMSLITWNLIPILWFYGALVVCLSILLRLRLLTAIFAVGVLSGFFWINDYIPVRLQDSLPQFLGSTIVPSDLTTTFVSTPVLVNACGALLVSIALILFAANALNRIEPRRRLNATLGIVALCIASIGYFSLFASTLSAENRKEEWVKTHQQYIHDAHPDVRHLEGTVALQPGNSVSLDVTLTVIKPTANSTDSVVFSLNPGYKSPELFVNGENTTNYSFENGLLKLPTDLLSDASNQVRLRAKGKLDDRFGYLDQARDLQKLAHESVRELGLRNSIFHRDYVALMPGIFWYPISGPAAGRDQIESRPRDVFTTDLKISIPRKWQVAMVGKRIEEEDQNQSTFRFRSGAPVPEIALLAANFDQRSITIEGVDFEVLFNHKHLQNFDSLTIIQEHIQEWVSARLKDARAASLEYPYQSFYIVEVPSNLRIYGGGWRMDSVLQPPGMMLIRETSFPTEPFNKVVDIARIYGGSGEDEQANYVFEHFLKYFYEDMQGSSPFAGFARNFVSHQLSATKQGATVLQHLVDQLSNQLITPYESGSLFSLAEYGTLIPSLAELGFVSRLEPRYSYRTKNWRERIAKLPSTWEVMDRVPLFDLDFNTHPIRSYRVLLTKGYVLAESMIAHFGPEDIGAFLKKLQTDFHGRAFTVEDFIKVADEVGLDFNDWVLPWLEDTILPGFQVEPASVSNIESTEFSDIEYQTTFILYNAEPIPGFVRVVWSDDENTTLWSGYEDSIISDPIYISGHAAKRISIRSANPITWIWIEPSLAHNRSAFEVFIPEYDVSAITESSPLPFVSEIAWQPSDAETVIVDDLDPEFSIVTQTDEPVNYIIEQVNSRAPFTTDEYDQGLRVTGRLNFGEWTRLYHSSSYGRYRRSYAYVIRGDESSAARFEAQLPREGRWKLELYVPKAVFREANYGYSISFFGMQRENFSKRRADPNSPDEHYTLQIRNGDFETTKKFDIANAKIGWNAVGEFEFSSTDAEVLLNDWAGHQDIMVCADAIRWTFVESQ